MHRFQVVGTTDLESALRELEQRHTLLFDSAPGPMWILDTQTMLFVVVNEAALAQYGYTRAEFLTLSPRDLRTPDDAASLWRVQIAMKAGLDVHAVARHRRRDGTPFDAEIRTSTLPIGEGRFRLALATDITAHKQGADAAHFLDRATSILTSSLEITAICRNLASLAVPAVGDWCIVHRMGADGQLTACGFAHANPLEHPLLAEALEQRSALGDDHPVVRAWRTRETLELSGDVLSWLWGETPGRTAADLVRCLGASVVLYVPVLGAERTLAVLECIATRAERPDRRSARALGEALAERAALAMNNAMTHEETRVALRNAAARGTLSAGPEDASIVRWLYESIPESFFSIDRDWTLTYLNAQAERLLQRPREQLVGRNFWELFPEAVGTTFDHEYRRVMSRRQPAVVEDYYPTFDAWFEVRIQPTETGIALFLRDVSQQHHTLARVEESEAQFRDFLDSATDLIHMLAPDGRMLYANRAWRETLGYGEEELTGLSVFDVVAPESREVARAELERCLRGGPAVETELVVLGKDGRRVVVRGHSNRRLVNGVPASTRAIYRDVTAEVETQQLLRHAQRTDAAAVRAKAAFLDRISHELRTPLTAVIGFADILQRNRGERMTPGDLDFVRRIGAQGRHLLTLVEDLLAYADIESRRVSLDVAQVDLGRLLTEVVASYETEAASAGIPVVLKLPDTGAPLLHESDADILRRVVRYLLIDAVKRGAGGAVRVRLIVDSDRRRARAIEVRDFAIEGHSSTGSTPVLELGLTVTRSLCQVLGDDLVVESDGEGGTLRRVELGSGAAAARPGGDETANALHAFIEASPLPIIAFAPDWTVRMWNDAAARLYGWPAAEVIDRRLPVVRPEDEPVFRELLRQSLDTPRGITEVPAIHLRRAAAPVDVVVSVAPLRAPDGRLLGFVSISADVSERMRLEHELRQAQKMEVVGRLAGGIAHDFNNLLTVISAHAQFLLADLDAADVRADDVRAIEEAAVRAAALTRQLLVFARKQVPQRRIVDLNRKVDSADRMLRRTIGSHIEFGTIQSPVPVCVYADPAQMEQVVMNLVLNARDAMPDGGALFIETALVTEDEDAVRRGDVPGAGDYAMLTVSDTGVGMDDATRRRIFEPFFTTKGPDRGTGIGLATVQAIVAEAGGTITVESAPGVGTTFRVRLPSAAPRLSETGEYPVPDGRPTGDETILLVEDQDAVRAVAARLLRSYGYTVLAARHGHDALAMMEERSEPIDLVLTDLVMPEMHGQELAARIRAIHPGARVLYMSGYDETPQSQPALDPSMKLVRKPFGGEELATAVREALDAPGTA